MEEIKKCILVWKTGIELYEEMNALKIN